jgi:hypothetical protein
MTAMTNLPTLRILAAGCASTSTIDRRRLKRIQYRTDLLDGFLSHTGLNLEPDSTRLSRSAIADSGSTQSRLF